MDDLLQINKKWKNGERNKIQIWTQNNQSLHVESAYSPIPWQTGKQAFHFKAAIQTAYTIPTQRWLRP